ncbi:MAG: hypothetical protein IKE21_04010 [Erysipelotrichaceae bacterium]|nr:hypothetical protein [Erysipelotrichaceae bacterium]
MKNRRRQAIAISLYLLIFLAAGFSRYFELGRFGIHNPELLICSGLIIYWGSVLKYRILEKDVRDLLVAVSWLMVAYFTLQMIRYNFLFEPAAKLYIRYLYLAVSTLIPILLYLASQRISHPLRDIRRISVLLLSVWAVLTLFFLTNPLHSLVLVIDLTDPLNNEPAYGPLAWLAFGLQTVLLALSMISILRSCRVAVSRRLAWIPLAVLLAGGIIQVIQLVDQRYTYYFKQAQTFCFMIVAFWETCIQIGLVPTNRGYDRLFALTTADARILDNDGKTFLASEDARELDPQVLKESSVKDVLLDEDTLLRSRKVSGGRIIWSEDRSVLNDLYRRSLEVNRELSREQELIREEKRLREDKARVEQQEAIYRTIVEKMDPIASVLGPFLQKAEDPSSFRESVSEALPYLVYAKRLANLTFLASSEEKMALGEVLISLRDLASSLGYSDISTLIDGNGELLLDGEEAVEAFRFCGSALREAKVYAGLLIRFRREKDIIRMRLILDRCAGSTAAADWQPHSSLPLSFLSDEDELIAELTLRQEGSL